MKEGYLTKPISIKGKTAYWGPQAGFICIDQNFSKLVGQPERVEKYHSLISNNIENDDAVSVPLTITRDRINELIELACLELSRPKGDKIILLRVVYQRGSSINLKLFISVTAVIE
ncbi:MAG: anthrax toxin-like adenylyl cyclase domain-containing protein [Arsenophonus endosymbiont of Dermacentor nuttalli]